MTATEYSREIEMNALVEDRFVSEVDFYNATAQDYREMDREIADDYNEDGDIMSCCGGRVPSCERHYHSGYAFAHRGRRTTAYIDWS